MPIHNGRSINGKVTHSKAKSFGMRPGTQFPQNLEPRHLDRSLPQPSHCITLNHGLRLNPHAHCTEDAPVMAFSKTTYQKHQRSGWAMVLSFGGLLKSAVDVYLHLPEL